LSLPENTPTIPVFAVYSKDYDYDDERYYQNEGVHLNRLFESEEDAKEYSYKSNLNTLMSDEDLSRYCDEEDPESIHGYDPVKMQKVRDALGLPNLTAVELIELTFVENARLTEEQAKALIEILDIGDFYYTKEPLYLRKGAAVQEEQATAA